MQHKLFCYGTLCFEHIFNAVIKHKNYTSSTAVLNHHASYFVQGELYPAMIYESGAVVDGVVYSGLTQHDLLRLDDYEGNLYNRQRVKVLCARQQALMCWTYLLSPGQRHRLSKRPWGKAQLTDAALQAYKYAQL